MGKTIDQTVELKDGQNVELAIEYGALGKFNPRTQCSTYAGMLGNDHVFLSRNKEAHISQFNISTTNLQYRGSAVLLSEATHPKIKLYQSSTPGYEDRNAVLERIGL